MWVSSRRTFIADGTETILAMYVSTALSASIARCCRRGCPLTDLAGRVLGPHNHRQRFLLAENKGVRRPCLTDQFHEVLLATWLDSSPQPLLLQFARTAIWQTRLTLVRFSSNHTYGDSNSMHHATPTLVMQRVAIHSLVPSISPVTIPLFSSQVCDLMA